jgi:hypothetical protein
MKELDELLSQALFEQSKRRRLHQRKRPTANPSEDYAKRLADKALYRRLISESDIAQDGLRFIWWFSQPANQNRSLDAWRRQIDKDIRDARYRNALRANSSPTRTDDQARNGQSQVSGEE